MPYRMWQLIESGEEAERKTAANSFGVQNQLLAAWSGRGGRVASRGSESLRSQP